VVEDRAPHLDAVGHRHGALHPQVGRAPHRAAGGTYLEPQVARLRLHEDREVRPAVEEVVLRRAVDRDRDRAALRMEDRALAHLDRLRRHGPEGPYEGEVAGDPSVGQGGRVREGGGGD
jgi:hypothetical protein